MLRLKKIIFASTLFFCGTSFATMNYTFQLGSGLEYVFPAQEAVLFSNVFMWTVKATCKITQSDDESTFSFKMIKNSASINGSSLIAGNSLDISIHPGDSFVISAPPGVRVELLNRSNTVVKANCSAA